MGVFELHAGMVDEYREFTTSFAQPRDARIAEHVESLTAWGAQ